MKDRAKMGTEDAKCSENQNAVQRLIVQKL